MDEETAKQPTTTADAAAAHKALPRWVVRAAEAAGWAPATLMGQIDDLLYDGWQPAAVRRKLEIPEQQERSLETYATKYRYRRVIAPLSRIRETLTAGGESLSGDVVKLFRLVMEQALRGGVDHEKLEKTAEVMLGFLDRVERGGQRVESQAEAEGTGAKADAGEVVNRILDVYGIQRDAGRGA